MNKITFDGNPLTLVGDTVQVGDNAPDFELIANDMSTVSLNDFANKTTIIITVPSLDTPVCDLEAKRFSKEIVGLNNNTQILCVSMDLPFAQSRWCGTTEITNIQTVSDYRDASLGKNYGVLIYELRLLARAIFIIDKNQKIKYIQIVEELTNEPNYEEVLDAVKKET